MSMAPDRTSSARDEEITSGALACRKCYVYYPIWDGVPRMLTYRTAVAEMHAKANTEWIRTDLRDFRLPDGQPPPGEEQIFRNFSTEWLGYRWTGDNYWNVTTHNMLNCKRFELGVAPGDLADKLLLEVGIGIGGTADALSREERCEIVGMDLSYAVDQAYRYFGKNARLHIVQASVFAPPFKPSTFNVVYSHGVLHHTYSTAKAFVALTKLPKVPDGMLYMWVYSHEQERATLLRRALMGVEIAVRPFLSKLPRIVQTVLLAPTLPLYILYQNWYRRNSLGAEYAAHYGWNEALHAARDRLTPPFAFRHSYDEVVSWFESNSYADVKRLCDEPLPKGVPESYPLNIGVRGRRAVDVIKERA